MHLSKNKKYFYSIALMLIASTYLPLVFNNLPSFIRSHHLWTIIWGISLLALNPKIFLERTMLYVLAYGLILYIATETIWCNMDDQNYKILFDEFYQIAIGVSVITYFHQTKDYVRLARLAKWALIFICITAVMSIISSALDPMYARNLIGVSAVTIESKREAILHFKNYGGGTYSTAIAFMCLFPIFIYYYKKINISIVSKKVIIILSIVVFFALIGMQIFANIIIAVLVTIIALFGMEKIKKTILIISIFFSIMIFIPKNFYINNFISISNYFEKGSELRNKFKDFALFIKTGANYEDNSTGAGERVERYPILINIFMQSPMLGCYYLSDNYGHGYKGSGAHLHWMNKLTTTGIVGFLAFFFILYSFIKKNLQYFRTSYKFYYILASLSILSYGLLKTIVGREAWYAFFVILPGLYYLPLLKRMNKEMISNKKESGS